MLVAACLAVVPVASAKVPVDFSNQQCQSQTRAVRACAAAEPCVMEERNSAYFGDVPVQVHTGDAEYGVEVWLPVPPGLNPGMWYFNGVCANLALHP